VLGKNYGKKTGKEDKEGEKKKDIVPLFRKFTGDLSDTDMNGNFRE
jgi:hypothetical protein